MDSILTTTLFLNLHVKKTDLLLNLTKHKLSSNCLENIKNLTYSESIKRIFVGIFVAFGYNKEKYLVILSEATLSGHAYTYCPTIVFFYNLYKKILSDQKK